MPGGSQIGREVKSNPPGIPGIWEWDKRFDTQFNMISRHIGRSTVAATYIPKTLDNIRIFEYNHSFVLSDPHHNEHVLRLPIIQ
jgi:hypothetical protein